MLFGIYPIGIFERISNFDSPIIPPVGILGFEAEKKNGALERTESQTQYTISGNWTMMNGQYSQLRNRIKKLLLTMRDMNVMLVVSQITWILQHNPFVDDELWKWRFQILLEAQCMVQFLEHLFS